MQHSIVGFFRNFTWHLYYTFCMLISNRWQIFWLVVLWMNLIAQMVDITIFSFVFQLLLNFGGKIKLIDCANLIIVQFQFWALNFFYPIIYWFAFHHYLTTNFRSVFYVSHWKFRGCENSIFNFFRLLKTYKTIIISLFVEMHSFSLAVMRNLAACQQPNCVCDSLSFLFEFEELFIYLFIFVLCLYKMWTTKGKSTRLILDVFSVSVSLSLPW